MDIYIGNHNIHMGYVSHYYTRNTFHMFLDDNSRPLCGRRNIYKVFPPEETQEILEEVDVCCKCIDGIKNIDINNNDR